MQFFPKFETDVPWKLSFLSPLLSYMSTLSHLHVNASQFCQRIEAAIYVKIFDQMYMTLTYIFCMIFHVIKSVARSVFKGREICIFGEGKNTGGGFRLCGHYCLDRTCMLIASAIKLQAFGRFLPHFQWRPLRMHIFYWWEGWDDYASGEESEIFPNSGGSWKIPQFLANVAEKSSSFHSPVGLELVLIASGKNNLCNRIEVTGSIQLICNS